MRPTDCPLHSVDTWHGSPRSCRSVPLTEPPPTPAVVAAQAADVQPPTPPKPKGRRPARSRAAAAAQQEEAQQARVAQLQWQRLAMEQMRVRMKVLGYRQSPLVREVYVPEDASQQAQVLLPAGSGSPAKLHDAAVPAVAVAEASALGGPGPPRQEEGGGAAEQPQKRRRRRQ